MWTYAIFVITMKLAFLDAQHHWKTGDSWVESLIQSGPSSAVDVIAAGILPNVGWAALPGHSEASLSDAFPTKENVTKLAHHMKQFYESSLAWAESKKAKLHNVTNRLKFLSIACQSAHKEFILSYLPHTLRSLADQDDAANANFFKNWSKNNADFIKSIDTYFDADVNDASPGDSTLHRIRHLFILAGGHFGVGNYDVWSVLHDMTNIGNRKVTQLLHEIEASTLTLLTNGDAYCGLKSRLAEIYGEFFRLYSMITSYSDSTKSYTIPLFEQYDSMVGSGTTFSLQEASQKVVDLKNRLYVSIKPEILSIGTHRRQKFAQLKNDGFENYLTKYFNELMVT